MRATLYGFESHPRHHERHCRDWDSRRLTTTADDNATETPVEHTCVICGEPALRTAVPSKPLYEIRRNGDVEHVMMPSPVRFCDLHFRDVAILKTRRVGACLTCREWRSVPGPCVVCGAGLQPM